jgi:hypothetical protein
MQSCIKYTKALISEIANASTNASWAAIASIHSCNKMDLRALRFTAALALFLSSDGLIQVAVQGFHFRPEFLPSPWRETRRSNARIGFKQQ